MNNLLKYTSPSWNEVLTEQAEKNSVCSGNSRKEKIFKILTEKYANNKYVKFYNWEDVKSLYRREIAIDFGLNSKIYKQLTRIENYGHPKKCPAMKHITNLIIF